jgi:hypothetical protein
MRRMTKTIFADCFWRYRCLSYDLRSVAGGRDVSESVFNCFDTCF